LDVDGLTHVSDPVQDRLRQIEMEHQAKVESLQRQLRDFQRRRATGGDGGASVQTSDLADEVVRRKKKSYLLGHFRVVNFQDKLQLAQTSLCICHQHKTKKNHLSINKSG